MGDFAPPVVFTETKWAQEVVLRNSMDVILEVWREFKQQFGREYKPVESYRTEGAKTLLFTMGSFSETAMTAIDKLQDEGQKIGLIRLRLWRPFPFAQLREAVIGAETLIVLDRALSVGGPGGPVVSEIRSALYDRSPHLKIVSFVGGLGGRDITQAHFETIIKQGIELARTGSKLEYQIFGVRE
jgi:pyruvate ferredoxin oxidoreductase alpha subunit